MTEQTPKKKTPTEKTPTVRIGTSGWSYDHWTPTLYPRGLASGKRLETYAQSFDTVELNGSFYHWPRAAALAGYRDRLPRGFRLSVKAPRGLTHARRLRDPEVWVERITDAWSALGARAGVLIVQLHPDLERDDERLRHFLSLLPKRMRVAVEFRHDSWLDDEVFALLEEHGAAYCVMSGPGLPCELRATADFVYLRFHGPDGSPIYAGSYSDDDLRWWADRIREWIHQGRDVYAYFNNDGSGNAVRNALTLRDLLG
jgi:uncharacterized protein YecE (DUF72 family)